LDFLLVATNAVFYCDLQWVSWLVEVLNHLRPALHGDLQIFRDRPACHHFAKNMCISIAVVGGSVSTGITINGKLTLGTEYLAWPQKLENLLNDRYRNCSLSQRHNNSSLTRHVAKHTVVNLAKRGASSANFCRQLQSWRRGSMHVIHYADLIIIDEVLNDDPQGSQYYEELVAILLKNSSYLSFPPALLWAGLTGWGNVLRRQVQMAQAHGFPMYHIPDIFIKHPHNLTAEKEEAMSSSKLEGLVVENQFQEFFIKRIFKGDDLGHLGGLAHSVIASFTLPVIEHMLFANTNSGGDMMNR